MAEADSFRLRVRTDQARSAGLAAGQPAAIVLRSRPGETFAGIEQLSDASPSRITLNEMAEVTVQLPARPEVSPGTGTHGRQFRLVTLSG